jgi:lipopolysaccharide export LptBFGC system permease protein LptF
MLPGYRTRSVYGLSLVMVIVILVVWMLVLSFLGQLRDNVVLLAVATAILVAFFVFTVVISIVRR